MQQEKENSPKIKVLKKVKLPKWVTTTIAAEEYGREELLGATFREFLLYMFCLILISIYVFGRLSPSKYYLTAALNQRLANEEVFEKFYTEEDSIFSYLLTTLLEDTLFKTDESENKTASDSTGIYILKENKVLGVPRIRQVKVKNDSCEIHGYFRRLFLACYNKISDANEDTESFGFKNETAWIYQSSSETEAMPYWGINTIYPSGGYYFDLYTNKEKSEEKIKYLRDNGWVTRGTRAVFIDFAVYNANLNLFCICKIIFEMLPTGGITPSANLKTATMIFGQSTFHFVLRGILYIFCLLLLFYLCEEIREVIYFKWKYLRQFWNWIDLTIIILGFLYVGIVEYTRYKIPSFIEKVVDNPSKYGNFEFIGFLVYLLEISGAVLVFFVYIKIFKFLNFNRRMAQLNNTLKQCAKDIAGFSVMFFIAFLAYAELGYLVFGSQVKDFSSFGTAMFTLLRTILGDFDYKEIQNANWLVAPIYFLTYMILVFFVLLNMFLAIINDTYVDVKTDIAIAPKEMEMSEYLKRKMFSFCKKLGCRVKKDSTKKKELQNTLNSIQDALRKCGFSDREIQMYLTRYELGHLDDLTDEDITKFFNGLAEEESYKKDGRETFARITDFLRQEEKLDELENSIVVLAEKVQDLLKAIQTSSK